MENSLSIQYVSHSKNYKTKPVYQYDYGRQLKIIGLNSAYNVQCHYSIMGMKHALTDMPGFDATANVWVSKIPNILLIQSSDVICHVYVTTENSGSTMFEITIPIMERIKPGDYAYTNDELISLNNILESLKAEQANFDELKQKFNKFIEITAPDTVQQFIDITAPNTVQQFIETTASNEVKQFINETASQDVQDFIDSKDKEISDFIDAKEEIISPLVSSADQAAQSANQAAQSADQATRSANNAAERAGEATRAAENAAINANNSIDGLDDKVSDKVEQRIAQITDALTEGSEYAAEVVSARTDENGVVHTSLKERTDNGFDSLKDGKANSIIDISSRADFHILNTLPESNMSVKIYGKTTQGDNGETNSEGSIPISGENTAQIMTVGKNLLSTDSAPATQKVNGFDVSFAKDGTITINGTRASATTFGSIEFNLPYFLPPGTYTLSLNNNDIVHFPTTNDFNDYVQIWMRQSNGDYTTAVGTVKSNRTGPLIINVPTKRCILRIGKNVKSIDNLIMKPQIEVGDIATSFEPYKSNIIEIPLAEPLYGNGEIDDTFENDAIIDGEHKSRITRHWHKLELTGDENIDGTWYIQDTSSTVAKYAYVVPKDKKKFLEGNSLCSHFIYNGTISSGNYETGFKNFQSNDDNKDYKIAFRPDATMFTDIGINDLQDLTKGNWTNYLKAQYAKGTPVTVMLVELEPKVTISDPIQLKTMGENPEHVVTTVESEVIFKSDTKHYVDRIGKRTSALEDVITKYPVADQLDAAIKDVSFLKESKGDAIIDTSAKAESHDLYIPPESNISVTAFGKTTQNGVEELDPDHPKPISGLSSIQIQTRTKNLLSLDYHDSQSSVMPEKDFTWTSNEGVITANGVNKNELRIQQYFNFPDPLPPGVYTISANNNKSVSSSTDISKTVTMRCRVDNPDNNADYRGILYFTEPNMLTTFITEWPIVAIEILIGETLENVDNIIIKPQIESGAESTPFRPYKLNTIDIQLDEPLYGNGQINDTIENDVVVNGEHKCRITRYWKKLEFTGDETWNTITGTGAKGLSYYTYVIGKRHEYVSASQAICSHLKRVSITSSGTNEGFTYQNPSTPTSDVVRLCVRPDLEDSRFKDSDKWKAYIKNQANDGTPVTFMLIRNEPIITLTDPLPLLPVGGSPEEIKANVETEVSFTEDPKTYIDQCIFKTTQDIDNAKTYIDKMRQTGIDDIALYTNGHLRRIPFTQDRDMVVYKLINETPVAYETINYASDLIPAPKNLCIGSSTFDFDAYIMFYKEENGEIVPDWDITFPNGYIDNCVNRLSYYMARQHVIKDIPDGRYLRIAVQEPNIQLFSWDGEPFGIPLSASANSAAGTGNLVNALDVNASDSGRKHYGVVIPGAAKAVLVRDKDLYRMGGLVAVKDGVHETLGGNSSTYNNFRLLPEGYDYFIIRVSSYDENKAQYVRFNDVSDVLSIVMDSQAVQIPVERAKTVLSVAKEICSLEWVPAATISTTGEDISNPEHVFHAGVRYTGIPYGSGWNVAHYVGWHVSPHTFINAANDSDSIFFKEKATNTSAPYYSSVCSVFATMAAGWPYPMENYSFTIDPYVNIMRCNNPPIGSVWSNVGKDRNAGGFHCIIPERIDTICTDQHVLSVYQCTKPATIHTSHYSNISNDTDLSSYGHSNANAFGSYGVAAHHVDEKPGLSNIPYWNIGDKTIIGGSARPYRGDKSVYTSAMDAVLINIKDNTAQTLYLTDENGAAQAITINGVTQIDVKPYLDKTGIYYVHTDVSAVQESFEYVIVEPIEWSVTNGNIKFSSDEFWYARCAIRQTRAQNPYFRSEENTPDSGAARAVTVPGRSDGDYSDWNAKGDFTNVLSIFAKGKYGAYVIPTKKIVEDID